MGPIKLDHGAWGTLNTGGYSCLKPSPKPSTKRSPQPSPVDVHTLQTTVIHLTCPMGDHYILDFVQLLLNTFSCQSMRTRIEKMTRLFKSVFSKRNRKMTHISQKNSFSKCQCQVSANQSETRCYKTVDH